MTLYKLYAKLRKYNWKSYSSLFFCTMLSVVLVTSYALIYLSPTVQTILPRGGDSRKQAAMISAAAIIGCAMFTIYVSTLFYRNKSREMGTFLALGANKRKLRRMIFSDVAVVSAAACVSGLALSFPVAWGIWNLFRLAIVDSREMVYRFGFPGLLLGMVFCVFSTLCVFVLGIKFVARTNIIDIINESRISEPVRDVKAWYGAAGGLLTLAGLLLGYVFPAYMIQRHDYYLPAVWNAVYILSIVGVYMLMVYTVVHSKRGRRPERYYKNIISISMMRFIGKQTVKNMCVIILLVFSSAFAIFYVPMMLSGVEDNIKKNPYDFSYTYEQRVPQVKKEELFAMAKQYGIRPENYMELEAIDLIVDGRSWADGEQTVGKIEYIYEEKHGYGQFFKASDIADITGEAAAVGPGEYMLLRPKETADFERAEVSIITNPVTEESRKVDYAGNIPFDGHIVATGEYAYVLNDEDYNAYYDVLPIENKYRTVLFNVEQWEENYVFAKELKNEIIARTPADAAVTWGYDRYQKKKAEAAGESYFLDEGDWRPGVGWLELSPENSVLFMNWRYYPVFKPLQSQDTIKNIAVFLMLFIYIGIICFAAVGIIAYTRGMTIAVNYRQVFTDLKHLGADRKYVSFCIRKQLRKIFFFPYFIGCGLTYMFTILICMQNDNMGIISASERRGLFIDAVIIVLAGVYIGCVYAFTYRRFKKTIGMEEAG